MSHYAHRISYLKEGAEEAEERIVGVYEEVTNKEGVPSLICYDLEKGAIRQYRVDRIQSMELSTLTWEPDHPVLWSLPRVRGEKRPA